MKTEKSLQDRIKRRMEADGWWISHLSPPNCPGFPDLLCLNASEYRLIEVKNFDKIGEREKMSAIFQITQPAFFLKMRNHMVTIAVHGWDHGLERAILMTSPERVQDIFKMGKREYLETYAITIT